MKPTLHLCLFVVICPSLSGLSHADEVPPALAGQNGQLPATAPSREPNEWKGPLPMLNQRPFQAAFLHFPARSPDVLERGQHRLGFRFDIANDLLIPNTAPSPRVEEDFETQRLSLSYERGLKNGWEAEMTSSIVARDGGLLDGPISVYHRLLGVKGDGKDNPMGRDNRSRGRSVFAFNDGQGNAFQRGNDFGIGDTMFSLRRQLSRGTFTSAARAGIKLPTASSSKILGSGGYDVGALLDARYRLAPEWSLFGSVGVAGFGASDLPDAKKSGLQGGLGFEWRKSARESFVAQIDAQTRAVTTGNHFADGTPVLASVGYKRRVSENRTFWASFSENGDYQNFNAPFFGNIGPDFTISLGYEVRR